MSVESVLDPGQFSRIEGVHRGYLYQHLYAVGCLFRAAGAGAVRITVEADEDVQVELPEHVLYIQVKTRKEPLSHRDVDGILPRFSSIRKTHESGGRPKAPVCLIVSNVQPTGPLLDVVREGWPPDVFLVAPGASSPFSAALPPSWPDLGVALEWCREQAAGLPLRTLAPLTLVWKLAGHVQFLATGHASSHSIEAPDLPGIFEQLVRRAQPDPEPLPRYRPQTNEPRMGLADAHVRLLLASGGFGKTAWAAEALLHSSVRTAYYDVATTASESLASSVFLEVCSRLYDSVGAVPAGVVLPGQSAVSSLKALDVALRQGGDRLAIIVDDIQRADPEAVAELVRSTTYIHWILLGQPSPGVTTLGALLGLAAEAFQGWSEETVALVCGEAGCRFSPGDILELRSLTGGAPLYVLNLAALAGSVYGGSVSELCRAVRAGTHAQRTWQEAALGLISGRLSAGARTLACVSAVSGVPVSAEEIARLGWACVSLSARDVGAALRELTDWRVFQSTAGGRLRLQDEFGLAFANDPLLGREQRTALERELKELLLASIRAGTKETARLYRFLELLGSLEEWEELIDVVTGISEWLRELGFDTHIYSILERGAAAAADAPAQRFWFNDTLAFLDISEARATSAEARIAEMKAALAAQDLGHRAHGALALKEMMLAGLRGEFEVARRLFENRPTDLQDPVVERVFRYNYAYLAWKSERGPRPRPFWWISWRGSWGCSGFPWRMWSCGRKP